LQSGGSYCFFADKDAAVIAARNRQRCGREQAFIPTAFANLELPPALAEALRETVVQRERFLEYGWFFAPKTPEKEKQGKTRQKTRKTSRKNIAKRHEIYYNEAERAQCPFLFAYPHAIARRR